MAYRLIKTPDGQHILCEFDPERMLLRFEKRRILYVIDLTEYMPKADRSSTPSPANATHPKPAA